VRAQAPPWLPLGVTGGVLALLWLWAARRRKRRSEDLGIALAELLAYVGDVLDSYQDAIANEGFLGGTSGRRSVASARLSGHRSVRRRCRTRRRRRRWAGLRR
jgi:hypothetical protein